MQLILAIDGDRRHAEQLASLVRGRLDVELVQATSAGEGLQVIGSRVPDLIMTSPLLSPFDDGVLAEYLRELGPAAAHVQTLRIPVLSVPRKPSVRSLFSLRRKRPAESAPDGCDPVVFADEIAVYLTRAAEERQAAATALALDRGDVRYDNGDREAVSEEYSEYEPAVTVPVYQAPIVDEEIVDDPYPVTEAVAYVESVSEPVAEPLTESAIAFSPIEAVDVADSPPGMSTVAPLVYEAETVVPVALPIETARTPRESVVDPEPGEPETANPELAAPAPPERTSSFEAALAAIRAAWGQPGPEPPAALQARDAESLETPKTAWTAPPTSLGATAERNQWGVFDPNQCGFSALVDKLDEVTDNGDAKRAEPAPVRVVSLR